MHLRLHPAALVELDEAVEYIAAERDGFGELLFDEIAMRVAQAARWPRSGTPIAGFSPRFDVRQFAAKRFRYVVVTAVVNGERLVVAIAHTSREPLYWRERLTSD